MQKPAFKIYKIVPMFFDAAMQRKDQVRWMVDLHFYVLLNSISSYQDYVKMIMKGCVQWNSVYG